MMNEKLNKKNVISTGDEPTFENLKQRIRTNRSGDIFERK